MNMVLWEGKFMNALVEIQGEKYNYKIWYRDDELLRRSFKLIMFYWMDFLKDSIYYIKDLIMFPMVSHT